jgi:hypothetical protein
LWNTGVVILSGCSNPKVVTGGETNEEIKICEFQRNLFSEKYKSFGECTESVKNVDWCLNLHLSVGWDLTNAH